MYLPTYRLHYLPIILTTKLSYGPTEARLLLLMSSCAGTATPMLRMSNVLSAEVTELADVMVLLLLLDDDGA